MRVITSARARAAGLLMLEVAGLAILLWKRSKSDGPLREGIFRIINRVRSIAG